jgi:subtilisin family serine protease
VNRRLLLAAAVAAASLVGGTGAAEAVVTAKTGARAAAWTMPGEVLVRFEAGVSSAQISTAHRALGAEVVKTFDIVPDLQLVRIPAAASVDGAIAAYQARDGVLYAQPNFVYRADRLPNDPRFPEMWGLNNTGQNGGTPDADIDAPEAWSRGTGSKKDVAVGVLDTGVNYNHEDLKAHTRPNKEECQGSSGVDDDANGYVDDCHGIDPRDGDTDPFDTGHGTHTAGTIGAVGDNAKGVVGVNWKVTIIACKIYHQGGEGTSAAIIECLQYMELMKAKGLNVVATNNSYGGCTEACGFDQATHDAIESNLEAGILFVASAGNENRDNDSVPRYPVGYFLPNVIGVAATDRFDNLASFSNIGDRTVHVGAPGVAILSTFGNGYASLSGTSMAAPHVVGILALLKSLKPRLDWWQLRNRVLAGGDPKPSMASTTVTGRRVNANRSANCFNTEAEGVLRPADTEQNFPVPVAYLDILCARPNGAPLTATITPGGDQVSLTDSGAGGDRAAGDGIYSGEWAPDPCDPGIYTFTFSNGEVVQSNVTC